VFRAVIPARHASARLAGKVLRPIGGKPMLQWVYERACAAGAREVLIATDDELIVSAARAFGAEAVLTARTHASGTDRIAEVARRYADRRIEAGRRTSEYKMYARLFSFWHVLHIPLFFMLLIAGVVHVIAINVY